MLWPNKGVENTDETISMALKRSSELDVDHLVVASNTGHTARKLAGKGKKIVCVTHHVGFKNPGEDEMGAQTRQELQEQGIQILTTTHLLAGVDRSLRFKFQGAYPAEIIASALRLFGQGVKVCVEIGCMALDAGLVPYGEEIISVAGSGRGADSACVMVPAHSQYFFDTVVKEIICMPREK